MCWEHTEGMHGCAMGIQYLHCWELGTRPWLVGEEAKKGDRGLKGLLEAFRKISLQEMSWTQLQKKTSQPAAAGKACQGREAKQRVEWTFKRLACFSSPEFKKQMFSYIEVATKGGGCAPSRSIGIFLQCKKDKSVGQICYWSKLSRSKTNLLDVGLPLFQSGW